MTSDNITALAATETMPAIVVNDRPLRDVSADALVALYELNDPPVIFARGDVLVRVQRNADGTGRVVPLGEDHLRGHLTRSADFVRAVRRGQSTVDIQVSPPRDVVRDLLTAEGLAFPHLQGLVSSPVVRPNGSILEKPGFDVATGLYYLPPVGFSVPAIPARPNTDEVAAALSRLTEVFGDFPYADEASRANAMALLLTPVVRPMISGPTPLGLVDSPQAGTGKGLHVEVASIIATGSTAAVTTAPRSDDEWRKRITSLLLSGQPVVLVDNIEGTLHSPSLAAAITAPVWQDRYLGQNRQVTLPVRVAWLATGNNIRLGGDLARRCYWVRLDARSAQPWRRTGFRYPDLVGHVRQCRPQLVADLLTLVQAWVADGQPGASILPLGSFQEWGRIVEGILGVAGVNGFLGNLDRMYDVADVETGAWTAFLEAWWDYFGGQEVTAAGVIEATALEQPGLVRLRNALPEEVADARPERRSRALGTALASREERRYGASGLRVTRTGTQHRAVCWKVVVNEVVSPVSP